MTLEALLRATSEALGYQYWGHEIYGKINHRCLRVYIDTISGITIDDCVKVNRELNIVLPTEYPPSSQYQIEVSSPGLDRILFNWRQCNMYLGHTVKVRQHRQNKKAARQINGAILLADAATLHLCNQQGQTQIIPFATVAKIRLVPRLPMKTNST